MKRSPRLLAAVSLFVLLKVVAGGLVIWRNYEDPLYQGKRLHAWIQEFKLWSGPVTTNALAVRHYGPRAERMLSQMLLARDSTLILKLRALAARQKFVKIQFTPAAALQAQALTVCECLDAEVKGTVPAISKLLADYPRIYKDANLADEVAVHALPSCGPDKGCVLAAALGHPDASIRRHAAELLATAPVPATDPS